MEEYIYYKSLKIKIKLEHELVLASEIQNGMMPRSIPRLVEFERIE
jgi:hypothetical protein